MPDGAINSDTESLVAALRKLRSRLSVQKWLRFFFDALFCAIIISIIWLVLTRLFPILGDPLTLSVTLLILSLTGATALAVYRRPTLLHAALEADNRIGLKERLTSSLELLDLENPMVQALHIDARNHLDRMDIANQFPFTASRSMKWSALLIMFFGLVYLQLPEFDLLDYREKQAQAKLIEELTLQRAEKLKTIARALEPRPENKLNAPAEIPAEMERIAADLKEHKITDKQALARLTSLDEQLRKWREGLSKKNPAPKIAGKTSGLKMTRDIAEDIRKGRAKAAAQKLRDLQEKLKKGELSEKEMEALKKEMAKLAKMLESDNSESAQKLAESLAKAAQAMDAKDLEEALKNLENAQMSLEDLASAMEQFEKLDKISDDISEWQHEMKGQCKKCRACGGEIKKCERGKKCKGICAACAAKGRGVGIGMKGPGKGKGGDMGELPDVQTSTTPTKLRGPITKGKALATIMGRGSPETDPVAEAEFVSGTFTQVRQEAEQALMKEEIPPGSKEFVRQYFSSIEPEDHSDLMDAESPTPP